jgi:hypothetical protein
MATIATASSIATSRSALLEKFSSNMVSAFLSG